MSYRPTGEQEAIIEHDADQHARILAGPGTGKSATLAANWEFLQPREHPHADPVERARFVGA
jgi:superfamily I DNA/RNA helicase